MSQSFDDIPAGSVCTVTETADGATATVTATVSGNHQTVTIPAGEVVSVNLMDVYQRTPGLAPEVPGPSGTLKVTKTIAGPAARQHGRISILVVCGGPLHTYAFRIPAHTLPALCRAITPSSRPDPAAPSPRPRTATLPRSNVVANGSGKKVTIRANSTATVHLTDIFTSTAPVTG